MTRAPRTPKPNPHEGILATRAFVEADETPTKGPLLAPTSFGASGLIRTSAAAPARSGSWRLALRTEYASSTDFIVQGDSNQRLGGGISGAWSVDERWELFGAFLAAANRNQRCADKSTCVAEPDRQDPAFIRSFGDLVVGGKGVDRVTPTLHLGIEAAARLYAASDELGFDWDATSLWVLGLATWDLGPSSGLPVIVHANLGYVADRSYRLASFDLPNNPSIHSRAVAGYAYGIGRGRVRAAFALEAPITNLTSGSRLSPFFEYQIERVGGSGDEAFAAYLPPRCGTAAGQTRCSTERVQQRIVLGLRANWSSGVIFDFGVEIGAGSVGYPFGAPLPPWNFVLGLGHASRPAPRAPVVVVERVVEIPAPVKTGSVNGRVLDGQSNAPIAGAIVAIAGAVRSRVATDPDGSFLTRDLLPGGQDLEVSAPGFASATVHAMVNLGSTTPLEVTLQPLPPPEPIAAPPATPDIAGPGVVLEKGKLVLSRPVRFVGTDAASGAELTAESQELLRQAAATLLQHPEIARVRIEAHWDTSLARDAALTLTQQQAEAVVRALTAAGVSANRLAAVGMGSNHPKGPNIGPLSRARNRRIEITVP